MQDQADTHDLAIQWFREASPYIKAHRASTVVLCLPDSAIEHALFDQLIQDIALLNHLGVRLVLSFGLRGQIDSALQEKNQVSRMVDGRRVTDNKALHEILTLVGHSRTNFEARLSMGLPNTPMSGARLTVASGNFVTAQPYGIHDGIDFEHTGTVRQVHSEELNKQLDGGNLVLLPPLAYSITGDVFNVPAEEVATEAAIALKADKLVFFAEQLPLDSNQQPIREASANRMEKMTATQHDADLARTLNRAVHATRKGVARVHLLRLTEPNALLRELFTRDGSGTLVTAERWENLRDATVQDINGIIDLIEPLQENGTLAVRTREQLEIDIAHFVVCEREGMVIACAAMFVAEPTGNGLHGHGEIACVVTHPDYRGEGRAADLIAHLESRAKALGLKTVMLLSTRASHWFIEQGYTESEPSALPSLQKIYFDKQRNSMLFAKQL